MGRRHQLRNHQYSKYSTKTHLPKTMLLLVTLVKSTHSLCEVASELKQMRNWSKCRHCTCSSYSRIIEPKPLHHFSNPLLGKRFSEFPSNSTGVLSISMLSTARYGFPMTLPIWAQASHHDETSVCSRDPGIMRTCPTLDPWNHYITELHQYLRLNTTEYYILGVHQGKSKEQTMQWIQ